MLDLLVQDVMDKLTDTLGKDESLFDASKLMKMEKVRALPVLDENRKLIGLITLREIVDGFFSDPIKIKVEEAMLTTIVTVKPDDKLSDAVNIMLENKFGCLPVVNKDGTFLGILTETLLLKFLGEKIKVPDTFFTQRFQNF